MTPAERELLGDHWWWCKTGDTPLDVVADAFARRFGEPPEQVFKIGYTVYVGPVKEDEDE